MNAADDKFYNSLFGERNFELSADYFLGAIYAHGVYYVNRSARAQKFRGSEMAFKLPTPDELTRYHEPAPKPLVDGGDDVVYGPARNSGSKTTTYGAREDTPIMRSSDSRGTFNSTNVSNSPVPKLNLDKGARNEYGGNNPFIFFNRYRGNRKKRVKKSGVGARNLHRIFVDS